MKNVLILALAMMAGCESAEEEKSRWASSMVYCCLAFGGEYALTNTSFTCNWPATQELDK